MTDLKERLRERRIHVANIPANRPAQHELDDRSFGCGTIEVPDPLCVEAANEIECLESEVARLTKKRDEAHEALEEIKTWSEAYPLDIFPEPDFKKAHEVLEANGMTLDAISASNMRHVLKGIIHIVQRALKTKEDECLA